MKNFYYCLGIIVFLFYNNSYSQNCNDLAILTTTAGSVCGAGSATLGATASGVGDDIYWYDAASGGTFLGAGTAFETPSISATTSYWATEVFATGITVTGQAKPAPTGSSNTTGSGWGLVFDATQSFTIADVEVFSAGSGGNLVVELQDATGTMLQSASTTVPGGGSGTSPVPHTVTLNFNVPAAGTYRLIGVTTPTLIREFSSANTYPYPLGTVGSVTSGYISGISQTYYWFYNWTITTGSVTCESPRQEVIATVNNTADEDILALPYTHTANSATYFNNYSGTPGPDCGATGSYLNGNDVVYKYTANDDYILTVELSGLSEPYSGVFIYNSCLDIGVSCFAEGSVNELTGTHSFQVAVQNTQDYYFVVSSADPTVSMNYTLTINGTTCANYPAPVGAANQNFIIGQTLADLNVSGPNLTWYSDVALTSTIPDDTALVDVTTYYVTQSFQGCEGAALAVTVNEVTCASLAVLNTTAGAVCGEGFVILEAQGAEPAVNTEIYWYDAVTGGNLVGKGSPFTTVELEQTTSFWAAEVALSGGELPGQAKTAPTSTTTTTLTNYGLQFNVFTPFTLVSVDVYPTTGGMMDLELRDAAGTVLETVTGINVPGGDGLTPVTLMLNIEVPAGNGIRLLKTSSGSPTMVREFSGNVYPYPIGSVGEITGGALNQGSPLSSYYWFYNWTVTEAVALCESSPRVEVLATVNNVADEMVTEPLPFVHTANTSTYGNNYQGDPGTDCNASGGNYLNGSDVVYQYSPTVGGVYSINLSGLSSSNAAVFVYESCYDIGTSCYSGAVSDGTTTAFGIAEVPMYDGFDYFIVVSTSVSPDTDYTLTIDLATINCVDYTAAPDGEANQFFQPGETLADLVVNGGNLTWYSDAAGTMVIPNTTVMVDATTYYVNQTLNGCVSDILGITVTEIDCSSLAILSSTPGTIVCKGTVVLEAVGNGGPGTEIFWYDDAVAGDRVGTGPTFTTPELTATTSYWAAEVFIDGQAPLSGQAKPAPLATSNTTLSNYGLAFEVLQPFTIVSVDVYPNTSGGPVTVELRASDGVTILESLTVNVPPGDLTTPHTIPLNFEIATPGNYRLMKEGSTSLVREFSSAGGNVFPYPISTYGQVNGGVFGTGNPNTTYYFFYNWTIGTGQVLCESPREEIIATVSQDGDIIVPAALPYLDTNNNTANYGNTFSGAPGTACGTTENYLNGNDVVYMYTPTMDDVIDIHLKDINGFYAGLFVYESCADIGVNCVAGIVAGASNNNISIEEFTVLNGQTYYIVVSSWLSSSIDYTLEINGFVCATFPAPVGDAVQDYAAPATLADLEVTGTMSASVLTWYSDPAGTLVIPDTTTLVDGTTYYVRQTFGTCDSPLLSILVQEIDCTDLDIVSTTGSSVVCLGSMTLEAVGGGFGDEIYWFDAQTGGNLVGTGTTFTTPSLTTTTSYWAAEVYLEQGSGSNALPSPCTPVHGSSGCNVGDNIDDFVLSETGGPILINHLGTGCSTNAYGDFTADPNLTALLIAGSTYDVDLTHTFSSSQWVKIWIDFDFDGIFDDATELMFQSTSGSSGGVTNGALTIPSSVIGSNTIMRVSVRYASLPANACNIGGTYGETHDYKVTVVGSSALCESPREEVIATVNQTGDKIVTLPLPYSDTDTTLNYGNNFSGGSGCAGVSGNYLDGNDVVYQFTPLNDDIINIELSGVGSNTGVFVYASCGDVGGNCLAGSVGIGVIEDFYVTAGQDYFIVIGSQTGSTSYTLDIYGFECTNLGTPTGDSPQIYVPPATLLDLDVDAYIHSTSLNWYSDAAGTLPIPDTTPLVDGASYWVSQTVLGCEGPLLEIIVNELDCTIMDILSVQGDVLCAPGGEMTLSAVASGNGNEIYWFDAQTNGTIVGVGPNLTVNVAATTSYWASEVYLEGGQGASGSVGPVNPAAVGSSGGGLSSTYQLQFDVVIPTTLLSVDIYPFASVGSNGTIEIRESSGALVTSVSYTTTVSGGSNPQTIMFNAPLTPGSYYMVQATPTISLYRNSSGATYPYTSPAINITGNTFSPNYYYHFYNFQYGGGTVLCESTPTEVIAEVNTTLPPPPTGAATQDFCGADNTVGDITVTGSNIQWYDASGVSLPNSTVLVDGTTYYATQTVNACEGSTLEVLVTILNKSNKPLGDRNQSFVQGETLADLNVTGDNLLWYSDPLGNNPLPVSTLLVDQTTYFVSQTVVNLCESETLDIKVHRVLDVDDIAFANLQFYPNPAQDYVTITNTGVIESVEVFSLLGQRVIKQRVDALTSTIDVTGLASGPYLLSIKIDGKTGIYKLIKK